MIKINYHLYVFTLQLMNYFLYWKKQCFDRPFLEIDFFCYDVFEDESDDVSISNCTLSSSILDKVIEIKIHYSYSSGIMPIYYLYIIETPITTYFFLLL